MRVGLKSANVKPGFKEVVTPRILSDHVFSYGLKILDEYSAWEFLMSNLLLPQSYSKSHFIRQMQVLAGRYCLMQADPDKTRDSSYYSEIRIPEDMPHKIVASVTHSENRVWAVIADRKTHRSIGIDSENLTRKLRPQVKNHVLTDREMEFELKGNQWLAIFAAKEAIFKALYPLVHKKFWFSDVMLTKLDLKGGRFQFQLLKDLSTEYSSGFTHNGAVALEGNWVHTVVEVAAA